jgi:hypothetical protein
MSLYWIYDIPSIELALGMKAVFLLISLTALVATRGIITKHFHRSFEADQAVSAIFGAVGSSMAFFWVWWLSPPGKTTTS